MASKGGTSDRGVAGALARAPQEFRFFQAVRLVKLFARAGAEPFRSRPLYFRTLLSLAFPASEIHDLSLDVENESSQEPESVDRSASPLTMVVTFMGLTGPMGALPRNYTELLIQRSAQGDQIAHEFFDIFSHRLIELFYKAWEKYRFPLHFELGADDHLSGHLLDLLGMSANTLRGRLDPDGDGFPEGALRFFVGALSDRRHSAGALEAVIGDYFAVTTEVQQFAGRWQPINPHDRTALGGAAATISAAVVGGRVWDAQGSVRLVLGPLSLAEYRSLLPGGSKFLALVRLVRWYVGWAMTAEIRLRLLSAEVPEPRLGRRASQVLLGRMGWLSGRVPGGYADDCVIRIPRESC